MSYRFPTLLDFKTQFVRDFPYATPALSFGIVGAEAEASIGGYGVVTGVTVTAGGCGYSTNPVPGVVIYGGGGIGAKATAVVAGGAVVLINLISGGYGYSEAPLVYLTLSGDNTMTEKVTDYDLVNAFTAAAQFNTTRDLFASQSSYSYAINLLAAHYLCQTVAAGSTGLFGKAEWLTRTKTVGNVSETYEIPERILKSPYLSKLSKTTYGAQFLELMSPQLIGNMKTFHRATLP